jgi:hypothetical protein
MNATDVTPRTHRNTRQTNKKKVGIYTREKVYNSACVQFYEKKHKIYIPLVRGDEKAGKPIMLQNM